VHQELHSYKLHFGYAIEHDEASLNSNFMDRFRKIDIKVPGPYSYKEWQNIFDTNLDNSPSAARDQLSELVKALDKHILTDIASKNLENPDSRIHKQIIMVAPDKWSNRLQSTVLKVGCARL
jgi:hypothetical protein